MLDEFYKVKQLWLLIYLLSSDFESTMKLKTRRYLSAVYYKENSINILVSDINLMEITEILKLFLHKCNNDRSFNQDDEYRRESFKISGYSCRSWICVSVPHTQRSRQCCDTPERKTFIILN